MVLSSLQALNNKLELINIKEKYDVTFLLLMSFSFFMPVNQKVSTIVLLILAFVSLLRIKHFNIKVFKIFIPFLLLYLLYAIAYYRDNYEYVSLMFERKAILLALPLVFSTYKINQDKIKVILICFVYGCIVAYFLSLFYAFYQSIHITPSLRFDPLIFSQAEDGLGSPNASILQSIYFLGSNFVLDINVTILAVYFSFAIGIILSFKEVFKSKEKNILIVILSMGVLQLFSIFGLAALLFVIVGKNKPKAIKPILVIALLGFLTALVVIKNKDVFNKHSIENIDRRVIIWNTSMTCIKDHFVFGIGAKKAQRALENNYPKTGDFGYASQINKLDSHNMYLQFILEIGIVGLIIYLVYIVRYYKIIMRNKDFNKLAILFISLVLLLNLTESAFNIYVGISFFVFFSGLFLSYNQSQSELKIS